MQKQSMAQRLKQSVVEGDRPKGLHK